MDSTIVSLQTTLIKGVRFTALNTSNGCFVLRGKDTIARYQDGGYFNMTFKDFNRDGYLHDLWRSIHIYKAVGSRLVLYKALPLSALAKYYDKWDFIKKFWYRNYKEFAAHFIR